MITGPTSRTLYSNSGMLSFCLNVIVSLVIVGHGETEILYTGGMEMSAV